MNIILSHLHKKIYATIHLPSSKSETNRALIINALTGFQCDIQNISTARDSVTMNKLLKSKDKILDVIDAGTTMRFLTAYLSLQNEEKIITGTERMCERPIGILVEALKSIGADISYRKNEGFPPLTIRGLKEQTSNAIKIRGDVSSQYISALLMIAPCLPKGLTLELTGEIGSKPYIVMTLEMMREFGVNYEFTDNIIKIEPQRYKNTYFYVESDWSGASYWYSVAAIAHEAEIELIGLKKDSLQGDAAIVSMMERLGITTTFKENSILIRNAGFANEDLKPKEIHIDFSDCPDIAQTLAVICAATQVKLIMTGAESLKIKETDRIYALQTELVKFNAHLNEVEPGVYEVVSQDFKVDGQLIETYKDHRMAMAFAPLALLGNLEIQNPEVVVKSYPSFWDDLRKVGFSVKH
jgi:3-phosphoshikimate 1-carboxyvinyltransferase